MIDYVNNNYLFLLFQNNIVMKKENKNKENRFERRFEDEYSISIWKYDKTKSLINPIEVEHVWKADKTKKTIDLFSSQ